MYQYGLYQSPYGQPPYYNAYANLQNQQQNVFPQPQQPQQQLQPTQPMQIQSNIEYVNGIEGAKALILPPNSQKIVLDSDNTFFYIKTTDQQGKPTVKRFKYIDVDVQGTPIQKEERPTVDYVTLSQYSELLENFDELRKEIDKLKVSKSKKNDESEGKK